MKFSLFPCRNCTSCIFYISHQHVLKIRNFAYDYSEHGKYIMLSLHECYWCYLSIFFIYVLFQNNKTNDSLQMCVVEETFIFYWRESIVAQHYENQFGNSSGLSINQPLDPIIYGNIPKGFFILIQRNLFNHVHSWLFLILRIWKQHKCPSVNEQYRKCGTHRQLTNFHLLKMKL